MLDSEALFVRVVETGSLKKVAEELGIEPSTVSRKIAKLEQRLNSKLIHRSTSRTTPTAAGQAYYDGLKQLLAAQQTLESELFCNQTEISGLLRIATTVDLGDQFITPVLSSMLKVHPRLSVELVMGSELVNLTINNIDVAVRIGKPANSDLYAKALGVIPRVLVASTQYLTNFGTPQSINDLRQHQFVLYSKEQLKMPIQFNDGHTYPITAEQNKVVANSLRSLKHFVEAGHGISWGPRWLYQNAINDGVLQEILPDHPVKGFEVNALYTTSQYLPRKVRLLIQQLESPTIWQNLSSLS